MKISKLFHWLYAILMLLPVFFIGGRTFYTIFNKNAKDSYSVKGVYKETQVLSSSAFVSGETYTFYYQEDNSNPTNSQTIGFSSISFNPADYGWSGDIQYDRLSFSSANNNVYIYLYDGENFYSKANVWGVTLTSFSIVFNGNIASNFVPNTKYAKTYNTIYTFDTLDNAFEYSVNQLNEVPLFSWAKDSFLVTPFSYITGLFGLASTSPINTMLSYWLSISIIWLVFDLVMYVPLLVHRWLDKGVLE